MLWVDYVIITLVTVYTVVGSARGLVAETLSFAVWLLAVWVGLNFHREFAVLTALTTANPAVRIALSFTGLLLITLLLGHTLKTLLATLIRTSGLGFFNRFWAMALGSLQGMLVATTLILLAGLSPLPKEAWWDKALLIPPFQSLAVYLRDSAPSEMASYIHYH